MATGHYIKRKHYLRKDLFTKTFTSDYSQPSRAPLSVDNVRRDRGESPVDNKVCSVEDTNKEAIYTININETQRQDSNEVLNGTPLT